MLTLSLAMDRQSSRSRDADGRMRVKNCILSTAEVNPYNGKEIPGWQKLGLDADKVYHLYRTPELLAKLAPTVNGNPIMVKHIANTANEPNHEYKGGSVYGAHFDGKHLRGDLLLDDARAIDLVESGKQSDLSLGYRYRPNMIAGKTPEGAEHDGIMEDDGGSNHLALVDDGRATGAMVNDHAHQPPLGTDAMPQAKKVENAEQRDNPNDNPNANGQEAGTAQQPAPGSPNGEANEDQRFALIGQAMKHMAELLEDIHGRLPGQPNGDSPMNANDARRAKDNGDLENQAEDRRRAHDEEIRGRYNEDRRRRAYDAEHEKLSDEEKKGEDKKRAHDAEMKKRSAEDTRRRAYDESFEPVEEGHQEGTGARGEKTPHGAMDAKSVDAVVAAAVKAERERGQAMEEAKRDTRDVLGDVFGYDHAGDIYLAALKEKGIDCTAITKDTAKIAWNAYRAATASVRPVGMAMDAAASNDAATANRKSIHDHLSHISVKG